MDIKKLQNNIPSTEIILFCINILIMLPVIIRYFNIIGLIIVLTMLTVFYYITVVKNDKNLPMTVYLTLFAFFDFAIYLVLNFEVLRLNFAPANFLWLIMTIFENPILFLQLFIIGVVIGYIGFRFREISWLICLSGAIFGLNIALYLGSNAEFNNLQFYDGTEILLLFFFVIVAIWTVFFSIGVIIAPEKMMINIRMSVILFLTLIFIYVTEFNLIESVFTEFSEEILELSSKLLPWWKIVFLFIIFTASAFLIYNRENKSKARIDAFIMAAMAIFILAVKISMEIYFIYNILLIAILFILTVTCLKNEINNKKTFGLSTEIFLLVELVGFIVALFLLKNGYWVNLIITILFVIVFVVTFNGLRSIKDRSSTWILIITGVVLETLALQWKDKFSIFGVVLLITIYVMSMACIFIINYQQIFTGKKFYKPSELPNLYPRNGVNKNIIKTPITSFNIFITVCVLLLCIGSVIRTMQIRFKADMANKSIEVSAKAVGEGEIESIVYTWTDFRGRVVESEQTMDTAGEEISVKSDVLTIIAMDSKGFRSTYSYFFPYWAYNLKGK